MGLLQPAKNQTAFLKIGLQGFQGSGKTFLAASFATGMANLTKNPKVAWFDTEKGSDFYVKKFEEAKIHLDVLRSRSFSDLLTVMNEAINEKYAFLVIDSITHVWRDLCVSYQKKKNRRFMTIQDWMNVKNEWAKFTELYVNGPIHIGMCGRAGYEYDMEESEDGKKEMIKGGTKMKAEGETGFEPDLLIETYKVPVAETISDPKAKKQAKGVINRCVVIKDRADLMNGSIIDRPKFEDFLPIIQTLNIGGAHMGFDSGRDSQDRFDKPDYTLSEQNKLREIAGEEIKEVLILNGLDGTSADAKKKRTEALIKCFGTSSWTAIMDQPLDQLKKSVKLLREYFTEGGEVDAGGKQPTEKGA